MGKKKTRQEKKIAELQKRLTLQQTVSHHTSTSSVVKKATYTFAQPTTFHKSTPQIYEYAYVTHDIIKTMVLTFSIIAFQVILFFLLRIHVLKLPGLSY